MCLVAVIAVALENLEDARLTRWSAISGVVVEPRRLATRLSTDVRLKYGEERIGRTKEKGERRNLT
jgi:hypothetical protein